VQGAIESVLSALNAAGVRYLVVGGVAVVLHGHLRTTADLDLIVQSSREDVLKAVRALRAQARMGAWGFASPPPSGSAGSRRP